MEVQPYRYAITRQPPQSMSQGITTQDAKVDVTLARRQHHTYRETLQSIGISVTMLDAEEEYPDSHFVEDAAIIHKSTAILTRPGAQARQGEVDCLRPALEQRMTVRELGGDHTALVDGGDVLFMGTHVFIGISDRTTVTGANCLKIQLLAIDPGLEVHFISFSGVLHLKSGLTALGPDMLLGNPEIKLHTPLPAGHIKWLPLEQGYAANSLVVNDAAIYFAECPAAGKAIQAAGLKPIALDLSEFRKMDGSFTCLSLLW
jgi:dimethylargininase